MDLQGKCIVVIVVGILHTVFAPNIVFWMMHTLYMLCLLVVEDLGRAIGGCAHAVSGRLFASVK